MTDKTSKPNKWERVIALCCTKAASATSHAVRALYRPAATIALAFTVAGIVISASGGHPLTTFHALFVGALGDTTSVLRTLAKATPLLFSGLAVAVALRAGLFNIGAEGQLLVGGIAAAWVGYAAPGLPGIIHLPLCLAAGSAAGAVWALVPGALKALRGAHEVIVTIMMNYVAIQLTHFLVIGPMKDPSSDALRTPAVLPTARLFCFDDLSPESLRSLGILGRNTNFSTGFILALAAAAGIALLLKRTALGFEIRAVGQNPEAARTAGIPVPRTIISAMLISGGLAGLAGSVEVLGIHRRFLDAFSPGYGFDSIAVAMLGGMNAVGVTLSSLFFGGLSSGSLKMEFSTDTPRQIAGVIQAVVILAVAAKRVPIRFRAASPSAPRPNEDPVATGTEEPT